MNQENEIPIKHLIGEEIQKIWEGYEDHHHLKSAPLIINAIKKAPLIFIGINPAISLGKREKYESKPSKELETYTQNAEVKRYVYYKKFNEIEDELNLAYDHLDLLYIQETRQSNIKKLLETSKGKGFVYYQLMETKKVMARLIVTEEPRIFVVSNTLARDFLGLYRPEKYKDDQAHWMDYRFSWDDEIGTYRLRDHPNKVFFFSSMLTGQRALDKGSFKRLKWHIDLVRQKLGIS